MIKALAPRTSRGCSWVWLSIVLVGGFPLAVSAQPSTKASAPAKAAAPAPAAAEAPAEEAPKKPAPSLEVFKDPNAEDANDPAKIQELGRPIRPPLIREVKEMASGGGNPNRETINQFVDGMVNILTSKTNINALLTESPRPDPRARALQGATDDLIDVLNKARAANNQSFLKIYNTALVTKLTPLLSGHLMTRLEAIIVLAQTGSPEALNVFLDQLADPKQTVWVKLWAARGLTNIVQTPAGNVVDTALGTAKANQAGKALAALLENGRDLPWPVQFRALEALGAMRLAADPVTPAKAEMASAAARYLTDPDAHPDVRAEAAWALGMMRVNPAITKYNFPLIAYSIGEVAADLGEKVVANYGDNPVRSSHLAGLLLYQIYPALFGWQAGTGQAGGARESGLLNVPANHPNIGPSREYLKQVADAVKAVSKASADLLNGTKNQAEKNQKELNDKVAALRAVLQKTPPPERRLVPGGPVFPVQNQAAAVAAQRHQ
jgi:HEAT repeat protein